MSEEQSEKDSNKSPNLLIKLSSMAVQMGVTIGGGVWFGSYLDSVYENKTPIWTIVLSLSAIAISLYLVIKGANRFSNKN